MPTVGLNIESLVYKRYSLTFWDVGGQATKLWKHYFDHIEGVMFVVDSTDEARLPLAKEELSKLFQDENLGIVPFLIYYNKKDVVDKTKPLEEMNKRMEINNITQNKEIIIQECSAVNG